MPAGKAAATESRVLDGVQVFILECDTGNTTSYQSRSSTSPHTNYLLATLFAARKESKPLPIPGNRTWKNERWQAHHNFSFSIDSLALSLSAIAA